MQHIRTNSTMEERLPTNKTMKHNKRSCFQFCKISRYSCWRECNVLPMLICCWLLIVDCWLLIVDCWLLIVDCWLLIVDCWLLIVCVCVVCVCVDCVCVCVCVCVVCVVCVCVCCCVFVLMWLMWLICQNSINFTHSSLSLQVGQQKKHTQHDLVVRCQNFDLDLIWIWFDNRGWIWLNKTTQTNHFIQTSIHPNKTGQRSHSAWSFQFEQPPRRGCHHFSWSGQCTSKCGVKIDSRKCERFR